jgi:hypothetical protein
MIDSESGRCYEADVRIGGNTGEIVSFTEVRDVQPAFTRYVSISSFKW